MGLLADRISMRFNPAEWIADDDYDDRGKLTSSGIRVNDDVVTSLTTVWRCWDLISGDVALSPREVIVTAGGKSFPEYQPPAWLEQPDPRDPTFTIDDYFQMVTLSLLSDGNYFTRAVPNVYNPLALIPLDPGTVRIRRGGAAGPLFDILDSTGRPKETLGADEVLYDSWMPMPGELRGMSPLENLRRSFGSAVAAEEFASRYFGQGAALAFGIEVPGALGAVQQGELRDQLRIRHQGLGNSHAVGVLTRGAKFVPGLQPTPEQSQMLATRKFGVEEIARIYGIPPGMAGSQEPGASSYASASEWRQQYRDSCVLKFAAKIERGHRRLLQLPDAFANVPGARVDLKFDLDWIARTDMLARFQAYDTAVKGGIMVPNQARHAEGWPDMPGGDSLYMLQQMVPIEDLGKTKATEPADTQKPSAAEKLAVRMLESMDREPAERPEPVQVTVNEPEPPKSIQITRDADGRAVRFASVDGLPDIIAILPPDGIFCGIEVKRPGKKLTRTQQAVHDNLRDAGALMLCVHSLEELRTALTDAGYEE